MQLFIKIHLLKHPFYIAWTKGQPSKAQLHHYAEYYFYNVLAEPNFLSAFHFNTLHIYTENNSGDISVLQVILRNLIDEEYSEKNTPLYGKSLLLLKVQEVWEHCIHLNHKH